MASLNKVFLMGRLGRDPELKQAGQTQICKFSLATDDKRKGEQVTTWHEIVTFGKQAETCAQFLAKGREVLVEGRINVSEYEKDGLKRKNYEIAADHVVFVGKPKEKAQQQGGGDDFDLPF